MSEIIYGIEYEFSNVSTDVNSVTYLSDTVFVVAYKNATNNSGYVVVGTIANDDEVSYGTPVQFNSSNTTQFEITKLDSTRCLLNFQDSGNGNYGTVVICTVSGTSISIGTEYVYGSGTVSSFNSISLLDSTHFVVADLNVSSNLGRTVIGTISGSTISYGTIVTFKSGGVSDVKVATLDSTHFVISYFYLGRGYVVACSVSGTTITVGTIVLFRDGNSYWISICTLDSTHFAITYRYDGGGGIGYCIIGSVSGTTITLGSNTVFNNASTFYTSIKRIDDTSIVIAYKDSGNNSYGTAITGTVSGTTPTFDTEYVFNSGVTNLVSIDINNNTNAIVIAYVDNSNSNHGTNVIGLLQLTTDYPMIAGVGTFTLTGQNILFSIGKKLIAGLGQFILTGNNIIINTARSIVAGIGSFVLTGNNSILNIGRKMIATVGNFTLTGIDILFKIGKGIFAEAGTFVLTGKNVLFHVTLSMIAGVGSFTLTGINVILNIGRKMLVGTGNFALTGINIILRHGRTLIAGVGSFNLTGIDILLHLGIKLIAGVGSFVLTGSNIIFRKALNMVTSVGTFTLTGIDTILSFGRKMIAGLGTFSLTGIDVVLKLGWKIIAGVGNFVLTGNPIRIAVNGLYIKWNNLVKNVASWVNSSKTK